jgi:diguanylate cyclase (GGDEF)-like protein
MRVSFIPPMPGPQGEPEGRSPGEDRLQALQAENARLQQALAVALERCERAEREARTDALTGLPNRRYILEACERELAAARRYGRAFSVLLFDLDHFKALNDTHGHAAGDAALVAVAGVLERQVRKPDLPARFGGEEFLVLLPDARESCALAAAERLRATIRDLDLTPTRITASFGVATWQPADDGVEDMLARADRALYRAKRAGRDRVFSAEAA